MSALPNFRFARKTWQLAIFTGLVAAILAWSGAADAKRGKKRRKKAKAAKVNVQALGELMGPYKFGSSKEDVLKVLAKQIKERYREQIRETSDVYKQDALRAKEKEELKKIKESFREFTGKKTGWDVSIIDDQFAHHTGESMLVFWENKAEGADQRRFFFFHEGELYKMFITLDSSVMPEGRRDFGTFKGLMMSRYGDGTMIEETKRSGAKVPVGMEWKTRNYHVQALDKVSFYGSFCLVIGQPNVEARVAVARESVKKEKKQNLVIDSMIEKDDDTGPGLDSNKSSLDAVMKNAN